MSKFGSLSLGDMISEAVRYHEAGHLAEAESLYRQILALDSGHADALHLLGVVFHQQGQNEVAAELIGKAIKINGTDPLYHNHFGIALYGLGRFADAISAYKISVDLKPDYAEAHYNLGAAFLDQGSWGDAAFSFSLALALNPALARAHCNLGIALLGQGRSDLVMAHYNQGVAFLDRGKPDEAVAAFGLSLAIKPDLVEGHYNLGNAYLDQGRCAEAVASFRMALSCKPDAVGAFFNLGVALQTQGRMPEAARSFKSAIIYHPDFAGSYLNLGNALASQSQLSEAEEALRQAIEIQPGQDAIQNWISLRQVQCKWPVLGGILRSTLFRGMSPLSLLFHTDDPLLQLARANKYYIAKTDLKNISMSYSEFKRKNKSNKNRRIRIGYISAYLREHAHGYLTVGMYCLHDRNKFEIFIYSSCRETGDLIQERIKEGVDHWVNINGMADAKAAKRISDDEIDILIDFNGYTAEPYLNLLAMQPAPIVVNWLAYPGSMGTPFHNYIIADDFIIPREYEKYYSEKVMRLPCYQPNDRARQVSDCQWTRSAAGLPEQGTVFCFFNSPKKLTLPHWRRMMSILGQVPGSVLWMLGRTPEIELRLRRLAQDHGIAPERLVFASFAVNAEHLARYPLADLFLDGVPYGGHTTASDALWMGVPVLTVPGRGFASRVCGSLARAAGIGDMICRSFSEYVGRAVELGNDRIKLQALRDRLTAQRFRCDLFDTVKLVSHLEAIFIEMYEDYGQGRLPRPNLSSLDLYDEIGSALDLDDREMMAVADYEGLYSAKLEDLVDGRPAP